MATSATEEGTGRLDSGPSIGFGDKISENGLSDTQAAFMPQDQVVQEANQTGSNEATGQPLPQNNTDGARDEGYSRPAETSTRLLEEIEALRERLSQLETQAANRLQAPPKARFKSQSSPSDEERKLRKQIRRARMSKRHVAKKEKQAEDTTEERHHFGGFGECEDVPYHDKIYMKDVLTSGEIALDSSDNDLNIESEEELMIWNRVHPKPHRGVRPVTSLRAKHTRKLGPPNQWDTSDSEKWSSSTSVCSRDFSYFRARLRGDFEWELDRLNHQRARYKKHKEKKAAAALEQARKLEEQREKERAPTPSGDDVTKDVEESQNGAVENVASVPTVQDLSNGKNLEYGIPALNSVDWQVFMAARRSMGAACFAIDVLLGEPQIGKTKWAYYGTRTKAHDKPVSTTTSKADPSLKQHLTGQGPLPERIRIHSPQLIKILSMIHGSELETGPHFSVVMTRPFRMLTYYEKEIRAWFSKLKTDLNPQEAAQTAPADSGPDPPQKGKSALAAATANLMERPAC